MSLFTVPMRLLTAVVLEQNSSLVVQELLKLGAMDFIHVETLAPEMAAQLAKRTSTLESAKLGELRTRIEALYRQAGFPPPGSKQLDLNNLHELDVHQISNKLDTLYDDLQRLRDRQKNLSQSMLSYNELLQYARDGKMQYLDIRVGRTEGGQIETLKSRLTSYAHVLIERSNGAIVLTLRR
ncbi:MAG: ATPase, partial [Spirochaetales bacterium]|nr:ATPase [Spirochaetales bacterium]